MRPIVTDRLRLIEPTLDYAADVLDYASDPEFCRYIDATPISSLEHARDFLAGLIEANRVAQRNYWIILDEGRCIGSIGFNLIFNPLHRTQDFGYGIGRCAWGQGKFREAATAVLQFGFAEMKLERIQASTRADNVRSVAALSRLGFEREATLKSFYSTVEGRADCAVFVLFRNSNTNGNS